MLAQNAKLGRYAFLLGLIIAVVLGFVSFSYSTLILVILGVIVGFMNIPDRETHNYLMAVVALLVIGFSGLQVFTVLNVGLYDWIQTVLTSFITFVAASGAVVAFKAVIKMGEE